MKNLPIDAEKFRPIDGGSSFSLRNRLTRLCWNATWLLLASWTPSPLWRWRRMLLTIFGAQLARRCDVRGSARVWLPQNLSMGDRAILAEYVHCYNQAPIVIGNQAIISRGAHLCAGTHDVDSAHFQLVAKPIFIGDHAWVATEAFVGPGAVVEEGAVLGARGVCFGVLKSWTVYAGNPCALLRKRKQ